MNLGETIYKYRISKNMSQGELAALLDVSRQSISKWENNSATPDLDKIVKLSEIFGISIDELVKGEAINADAKISEPQDANTYHFQEKVQNEVQECGCQQSSHTEGKSTISTGQKIAGTILLCMAFLVILLLGLAGSFFGGLVFAIPFIVCGIICFNCRCNAGLWCGWSVYFLIDVFMRVATGVNRSIIFNAYYYQEAAGSRTMTLYLITGWIVNLVLVLLTVVTVFRFKNKPLEMNNKNRKLFIAGLAVAVGIKILQVVLSLPRVYSILINHIVSFGTAYYILYSLIDWIKMSIVIALMTNFARYKFKPTVIISLVLVFVSVVANFVLFN